MKELLSQYVRTKLPVTSRSGAVIKKPVKREIWELNNDDVQLIEKIGKVRKCFIRYVVFAKL